MPMERPTEEFISFLCGKGFIIHLYITGTENAASCKDVVVTVTASVRVTYAITVVIVTGIICKVNVMTPAKYRSKAIVAIDCIGRNRHVFLEIAISIIIFQRVYESFRRGNVTNRP